MDKPRDSFTVIYAQMNYKVFEVLPIFIFAFTCHQNVYRFLQKFSSYFLKMPTVFNELGHHAQRRRSSMAASISTSAVMIVYAIQSSVGYMTWGPNLDSNIINNCYQSTISIFIYNFRSNGCYTNCYCAMLYYTDRVVFISAPAAPC